jgi:UDP-3-O-[3-hydroxymyristoyl] glucosamine N-acyltransferase
VAAPFRGVRLMSIAKDVILGERVVIVHRDLVNLYGCHIGNDTKIGAFVEVQKNAHIGERCKNPEAATESVAERGRLVSLNRAVMT